MAEESGSTCRLSPFSVAHLGLPRWFTGRCRAL